MLYSRAFIPTLKEAPKDATVPSHALLVRAGYVRQIGAGLYEYLPLGHRVLRKVTEIVRIEMDATGAQEILMPALLPAEHLEETGRWTTFGDTLFRLKDRKGGSYALGPTHEEIVTDLVRRELKTYRQLPLTLYQVQTKFRDEPRPRAGLLRGREFLMKDAYSFDIDEQGALASYESMRQAYHRIFKRLRLNYRMVHADSGAMGGSTSAEFQVLVKTGEDEIVACPSCDYAANVEVADLRKIRAGDPCPACAAALETFNGIEGGHIFILGTHYSAKMNANYQDESGKQRPIVMGCYGIGISRLMAAIVEQNHDQNGILWPIEVAPFQVIVSALTVDGSTFEVARKISDELRSQGIDVLLDDRTERPGVKFKDADLLGIPIRVTVGERGLAEGVVELKRRNEQKPERVKVEDCVSFVREWIGARK